MERDPFDASIGTPRETFGEQVAVTLADGLALERPPAAGLADVALACGGGGGAGKPASLP